MSSLACKCVFYRPGPNGIEFWRSWNAKLKYTKEQNLKSRWEKWCHLSNYHVYSRSYGQIWLDFCIFCWWQQKISHSLSKVFTYIWKILFSSFRKCYDFSSSELPLARYQLLKVQDFGIFYWLSSFLYFYPQYFTKGNSKVYQLYHFIHIFRNHTIYIFQENLLNILSELWLLFSCH